MKKNRGLSILLKKTIKKGLEINCTLHTTTDYISSSKNRKLPTQQFFFQTPLTTNYNYTTLVIWMQNKLIGDNLLSNCQKNKTVSRSKTKESEKYLADNQTNTFPPLLHT